MRSRRDVLGRASLVGVPLAVLVFAVETVLLLGSDMDDPYIFARYARHLWRYGDVLWNSGEPRIEGFSSPLWLLVYVVGIRLMPDPVVFARLVGLVLGCALVGSFTREVLRDGRRRLAGLGATTVLVGSPALAYYAGCGMDHVAWCLIAWLYILWIGSAPAVGRRHLAIAALGLLVRPEGFLLFAPALAVWGAESLARGGLGRIPAPLARLLAPGVGVTGGILLLRHGLFGAWLPNAAAAKHWGGSLFLRAIGGGLYAGPAIALYLLAPAAALALAGALPRGRGRPVRGSMPREDRILVGAAAFTAVLVVFTIVAGGDDTSAFGHTRLLSPLIAPATYVLYWALREPSVARWGPLRIALLVLTVLAARIPSAKEVLKDATRATNLSSVRDILFAWQRGLEPRPPLPLSVYLEQHTPPGEYIAVPWAGLVPFQTDLPVIDLLGLNDAHIAATPRVGRGDVDSRYDPDYVLDRRPYFICENFRVTDLLENVRALSDKELRALGAGKSGQRELLHHPRLDEQYEIDAEVPWDGSPWRGTCLRRRDAVPRADHHGATRTE